MSKSPRRKYLFRKLLVILGRNMKNKKNTTNMKKLLLIMLAMVALQLNAQNVEHYSKMVKELSSKKYMGRGYAYDGAY